MSRSSPRLPCTGNGFLGEVSLHMRRHTQPDALHIYPAEMKAEQHCDNILGINES